MMTILVSSVTTVLCTLCEEGPGSWKVVGGDSNVPPNAFLTGDHNEGVQTHNRFKDLIEAGDDEGPPPLTDSESEAPEEANERSQGVRKRRRRGRHRRRDLKR